MERSILQCALRQNSLELTLRFENIPRSLLGLFVDQKFGLLIYSPVYVLAAFGIGIVWRDRRWRTAAIVVICGVLSYALNSSRYFMWWGGASAPARFLVPILPLLALPIAAALVNASSQMAARVQPRSFAISLSLIVAGGGLVMARGNPALQSSARHRERSSRRFRAALHSPPRCRLLRSKTG